MRYQYIFVAQIRGLLPPKEAEIVVDIPAISGSATYTGDWNAIPEVVDFKSAVSTQMLVGLPGEPIGNRAAELEREVQRIRQTRCASKAHEMLTIVRITGEAEDFELKHTREDEGFIVCLSDSPSKDIQKAHKRHVQSLLAALNLASPQKTSTKVLADSVLFYRDDEKPIFCYQLQAYATGHIASPMTQDIADEAAQFTAQLSKGKSYTDVIRLLSKSMDLDSDRLLSFLSAWAALEIFVGKAFKEYENLIFDNAGSGPTPAHPEVIKWMRKVMSGKFRLTDKFAIIAGTLGKDCVDADLKMFAELKGVRDKLFHGNEIQIRGLPCETTRNLASKYLKLHLTLDGESPNKWP